MKIKGQFQWTDYLNVQLLHMQPGGFAGVVRTIALSIIALAFVVILVMSVAGQFEGGLLYIFPLLILVVFFPLYRYVLLPNRIKKIFTQQKELSSPIEFEFTETGISTSNEFGNNTRPWSHFVKWKENADLILLYHSDLLFSMLPKRFFTDIHHIETVRSYLENNQVPVAKNRFLMSTALYLVIFIVVALVVYLGYLNTVFP